MTDRCQLMLLAKGAPPGAAAELKLLPLRSAGGAPHWLPREDLRPASGEEMSPKLLLRCRLIFRSGGGGWRVGLASGGAPPLLVVVGFTG